MPKRESHGLLAASCFIVEDVEVRWLIFSPLVHKRCHFHPLLILMESSRDMG